MFFFVISGFLISSIILESLHKGTFNFGEFYVRRIRRIFPALITVMTVCLVFGWGALLPDEYAQLGKHVAASAAFVSNFFFWQEAGYFDNAAEAKPLLHLWSLGIEEQYYIIWPVLLYLAWKRHVGFLILAGTITVVSFALNVWIVDADAVQAFFSPLTRFWELLIGSLLAYLTLHKISIRDQSLLALGNAMGRSGNLLKSAGARLCHAQSILGMLLIGIAALLLTRQNSFPGWWALLPTVGACLIISAGQHAWLNRTILANRVMVWIGLISYPLYLWHWPLLSYARIMESKTPSPVIRLAAIALAILLAWLTYRFIERPLRFSEGRSRLIMSIVMTMLAVSGYGIYYSDGIRGRFSVGTLMQIDSLGKAKHWAIWSPCAESEKDGSCRILQPDRPPQIALLGDSHAMQFTFALEDIYASKGFNIIARAKPGCTPFFDISEGGILNAKCDGLMERALNDVLASPTIDTVVMGSFGMARIQRINQSTGDDGAIYKNAMYHTVRRLLQAGKKVVFIVDVASLDFNPEACVQVRPLYLPGHEVKTPCAISRQQFDSANAEFHQIVSEARSDFPLVKFIDAYKYLCDENYCRAIVNGELLYRDDTHLNVAGAHFFAERAAGQFLE